MSDDDQTARDDKFKRSNKRWGYFEEVLELAGLITIVASITALIVR